MLKLCQTSGQAGAVLMPLAMICFRSKNISIIEEVISFLHEINVRICKERIILN